MKKHKPLPTLEELSKYIRHVDLTRLENRLVGKPLVELEHCLIECLGSLNEQHQGFKESIAISAKDCIEADNKNEFLSCHRNYQNEKNNFSSAFNLCSPVGEYFDALRWRLSEREDKQIESAANLSINAIVPLTHARILAVLVCVKIESMWASSQYRNDKVNGLWDHWMGTNIYTSLRA